MKTTRLKVTALQWGDTTGIFEAGTMEFASIILAMSTSLTSPPLEAPMVLRLLRVAASTGFGGSGSAFQLPPS